MKTIFYQHPGRAPENFQFLKQWRHYLSTLTERIMVSYQNEAHLVHEFFFGHFPLHEFFFGHFPLHEFFFGFFPTPPITFLMVRP